MSSLVAPGCSITKTMRGRFFWAAWWRAPPTYAPFAKPDASDGGAPSREAALAAAEARAGMPLLEIDPLWARAWMEILRGRPPWPSQSSREPRAARSEKPVAPGSGSAMSSVWAILGVTASVTEEELKLAYRKRARETHPDHGGDAEDFRRVLAAYAEARRRLARPKRRAR